VAQEKRVFSAEFKRGVVQRILNGESVSALQQELKIKRSVLYRWRDAYREQGAAGLQRAVGRQPGVPRPPQPAVSGEEAAAQRIRQLEQKIGQQAMDIDFLRRAFKRVKESRRNNTEGGAKASTPRSEA
jgi:transposase-like protein